MQKQSWLASFTDLLILLICMFVMIFSLSEEKRRGAEDIVSPKDEKEDSLNLKETPPEKSDGWYVIYSTINETKQKLPFKIKNLIKVSYLGQSVEVTLYYDKREDFSDDILDKQVEFLQEFFKSHFYNFRTKNLKVTGFNHNILNENSSKFNISKQKIVSFYNSLFDAGYKDNLDLSFANIPRSRYSAGGYSNIFMKVLIH
jgi:hypothetical protein